jgi:hypothetical protein
MTICFQDSSSISVAKIKEASHETSNKKKVEKKKMKRQPSVRSIDDENINTSKDNDIKQNDVLAPNDNTQSGEAINEEQQRLLFCKKMQEADSEFFEQLCMYYENEGYSVDESKYFAAYYTALRIRDFENS